METTLTILLGIVGLFNVAIGLITSANGNFASRFVFKFMPFFTGCLMIFSAFYFNGDITITFGK